MTAVCGRDGQWTPNPGGVTCSPRPTFTETATPTETSTPGKKERREVGGDAKGNMHGL